MQPLPRHESLGNACVNVSGVFGVGGVKCSHLPGRPAQEVEPLLPSLIGRPKSPRRQAQFWDLR
jgi:hypothetical protein